MPCVVSAPVCACVRVWVIRLPLCVGDRLVSINDVPVYTAPFDRVEAVLKRDSESTRGALCRFRSPNVGTSPDSPVTQSVRWGLVHPLGRSHACVCVCACVCVRVCVCDRV